MRLRRCTTRAKKLTDKNPPEKSTRLFTRLFLPPPRDGHKNHIRPDVREVERSLGEEMDYFLDFEIFFTLCK